MKRILKKDYVEFMTKLEKLVINNLNISNIEDGVTCRTFVCHSDIVGLFKIHIDKFDAKYNNEVYYACINFDETERTKEAFGDGYYNANIGYSGKMTFAAFEDEEEKEMMYNHFYDLIDAVIEDEMID